MITKYAFNKEDNLFFYHILHVLKLLEVTMQQITSDVLLM